MPLIPSDPTSWSFNTYHVSNYFVVASSAAVVYDWALTLGQEHELIWRQRRSLITSLYIIVRCIGLLYSVTNVLLNLPGVLKTAMVSILCTNIYQLITLLCNAMNLALLWTIFIVNPMLSVIMITRLHAMYQRSRKMLIFLVITLSSIMVTCGVIGAVGSSYTPTKVILLNGTQCVSEVDGGEQLRMLEVYTLATVWHVLTLCLAIWIFVKHFRELQPPSTGQTFIGDRFMVLIKTQVLYFAFFAAYSCLNIGLLSPVILDSSRAGAQIYRGILEFVTLFQMFVVGPRLILSVREYHAKLLVNFDEGTFEMPVIVFQGRLQVSPTGSDVWE
ncbi:hypothetical protein EV702DRAFT_774622 [Suillus placidus]|uniref:DUF6533 domain-containing protein n=1 Tax=Suillus placidus TaxID=48579 RepID=A0A9P7D6G8_9AGAM|nr:hypothetical protein EV702DRAFT_774622 [Suillus placidus]